MERIWMGAVVLAIVTGGCGGSAVGPGAAEEGVARSDGVDLRYIVDFPEGAGPFPLVVYGPGSGDVSANHPAVREHAGRLVGLGYAVARYDKRGVGGSGGTRLDLGTANSEDVVPRLANDMLAVLRAARETERVDANRLGLFGASQATWYMPLVAAATPEVRFMVVLTGGLLPVGPKSYWEQLVFVDGLDPFSPSTLETWRTYDGPDGFDQRTVLRTLDRPMLYLTGGRDPGSPPGVMREEAGALRAGGVGLDVEHFDDGTHLLPEIEFWGVVSRWLTSLSPPA